jgi:hypothetical protein
MCTNARFFAVLSGEQFSHLARYLSLIPLKAHFPFGCLSGIHSATPFAVTPFTKAASW